MEGSLLITLGMLETTAQPGFSCSWFLRETLQETIIFTCHVSSLLKCLQLSDIIKCGHLKLHKNFLYKMERSKYVLKYFLSLNYDQLQTFFRQSLAFIYVLFILRGTRKEGKVVGSLVPSSQPCLCISQATEVVVLVTLFLALHHLGRESELSHTFWSHMTFFGHWNIVGRRVTSI